MTRDEIIEALERGETRRELDCYIHVEAVLRKPGDARPITIRFCEPPTYDSRRLFFNPLLEDSWIGYDLLNITPHYCTSRDAMLPGAENLSWRIETLPDDGGWIATAWIRGTNEDFVGIAPTEPLARRIAELKALVKP